MFIMSTLKVSTNSDTWKLTYTIFDYILLIEDIVDKVGNWHILSVDWEEFVSVDRSV